MLGLSLHCCGPLSAPLWSSVLLTAALSPLSSHEPNHLVHNSHSDSKLLPGLTLLMGPGVWSLCSFPAFYLFCPLPAKTSAHHEMDVAKSLPNEPWSGFLSI